MDKATAAPEAVQQQPPAVERVSSEETKQAGTHVKGFQEPKDPRPLPISALPDAVVETTTKFSPASVGKPPMKKPCDVADDESTLASTFTGYNGPVSYVEFSNSNQHKERAAASGTIHEVKVKPIFEPEDSRLASIPKLLVADLWSDDETKLTTALGQMSSLCSKPENIAEMLSLGGHMSLTLVLRKWSSSSDVQSVGLETLHKAAESLDFCNAVVQLGALELVVVAMKNHPNTEDVLTAGCGALLNLTLPATFAKQLVFELDGIQTVARACAAFPNNVLLQKYALWLIQYMSYWDDFKAPIVKAGGLQILTKIVETFSATSEKGGSDTILKSARSTIRDCCKRIRKSRCNANGNFSLTF